MDNEFLISILIPVYNREDYIEECINSCINQTYKNIEIIVSDNDSTDSTLQKILDLADGDGRIKIIKNQVNLGAIRNWERCINSASGKYAKFLWSDDILAPEFLESCIKILERVNVGFVYTQVVQFSDLKSRILFENGRLKKINKSNVYIDGVLKGYNFPVSPGCALFRLDDMKSAFRLNIPNKHNIDYSSLAIGNDLLFFLFTAAKYDSFGYINKPLASFRNHSNSITHIYDIKGEIDFYYWQAKTYFIENYLNVKLARKYNSHLFLKLLRSNSTHYQNLTDYYFNKNFSKVNYLNVFSLLFLKGLRKITKIFRCFFLLVQK